MKFCPGPTIPLIRMKLKMCIICGTASVYTNVERNPSNSCDPQYMCHGPSVVCESSRSRTFKLFDISIKEKAFVGQLGT